MFEKQVGDDLFIIACVSAPFPFGHYSKCAFAELVADGQLVSRNIQGTRAHVASCFLEQIAILEPRIQEIFIIFAVAVWIVF